MIMRCKVTVNTSHYPKEGPWELPEGWIWSSLGDISDYGRCITVPVSDIKESEWILELEDIEKDTGRVLKQIAKRDRSINGNRHFFTKNQILYSKLRTYLNKVLIAPRNGYCTTEIIPISPKIGILPEYLNLVLRSPYFQDYAAQCGYGVKMPRLGTSDALRALIPIPPYKEQQRIIEYADKYTNIIEIIHSEKEQLSDYVTRCKSIILDLAIHGKLVPQDPSDEPAIELLKRINPTFTPSDNLHYYSLPVGWCECRLQDCVNILNGFAFKSSEYTDSGIRVMRITNVQNGYISDDEPKFYPSTRASEIDRYLLKEGDLLMSLTGNVGRVAFLEKNMLPAALNQRVACIRSSLPSEVLSFVYLVCQTKEFADACASSGKGVAQLNISTEWLKEYRLILPPLNETRRILKAVNQYLLLLDEIANI